MRTPRLRKWSSKSQFLNHRILVLKGLMKQPTSLYLKASLKNSTPSSQKIVNLIPGTCKRYHVWEKGFCISYYATDLDWIIQEASKCHLNHPYKM